MTWNGGHRTQWLAPIGGVTNPVSLRYLNEPRTGASGYLTRSGKYIVASNTGQRMKFRGTNNIWQSSFPQYSEAQAVAESIANAGYNLLRVNGDEKLRGTSTSSGFWFDNTAADYLTFDTTPAPDNFLQLWDNFAAELGKVGVYVSLSLYNITPYPAAFRPLAYQADVWPGTSNYGTGLHFLDVKKDRLKQYLTNLLTRPNSVTGIAPVNDPTYAIIYLINEDSIAAAWYASNNWFKPATLSGQARTDMIARWSNYANNIFSPSQGPQTEMLSSDATPWGAAPTFAAASANLKTAWCSWLRYEDALYANEMYAFIRALGYKSLIMISTANYLQPGNYNTDLHTSHLYSALSVTGGTQVASTSTTRTAGSNVVSVASASGIVPFVSVENVAGMGTDSYVVSVAGLDITLDKPCTSSGTTTTRFYSTLKESSGHFLADHTGGAYSSNTCFLRDWNLPYITDELGMTAGVGGIGATSACLYLHYSILQGLQDTDGYAQFGWNAPQSYPVPNINKNNYAYGALHSEKFLPEGVLGGMALNLLTAKGYMSRLPGEVPMSVNEETLVGQLVAFKAANFTSMPTGIQFQAAMLQRRSGLIYTGPGGFDNSGATLAPQYPANIGFSNSGVVTVITGEAGDKYTWCRSRDGGTYVYHESLYDFVAYGILPVSYTSGINGVTIQFPVTLTSTCTCTSGSNVIDVADASMWSLGDYVRVPGVYWITAGSNAQNIARVADIDTVLNKLTLVSEGGNTGIVAAPAQSSIGPGAVIERPQWGQFALISMDGTPLGQGKAMLICNGTSWPLDFKLLSNTEFANANCVSYPNIKALGANARAFVDLPIGKITMPSNVSVVAIDSEGKRMSIAKKTLEFGLSKNPLYLVTKA